ncbi:peptidoglycan-binding protein [Streptomyces sp. NPDC051644]|uniref:peptidoglycan-binding protein n=1 Tax=Streptomyces sp. NPDC051644 TaxID=3365666 RepID=UPI0037A60CB1
MLGHRTSPRVRYIPILAVPHGYGLPSGTGRHLRGRAPHASRPASAAPPASLTGPTLRRGDQGPAVAELQRRLEEIWLFHGRDDGDFTGQVEHAVSVYQSYKSIEGDPSGVYGPNTRRALEAETTGRERS